MSAMASERVTLTSEERDEIVKTLRTLWGDQSFLIDEWAAGQIARAIAALTRAPAVEQACGVTLTRDEANRIGWWIKRMQREIRAVWIDEVIFALDKLIGEPPKPLGERPSPERARRLLEMALESEQAGGEAAGGTPSGFLTEEERHAVETAKCWFEDMIGRPGSGTDEIVNKHTLDLLLRRDAGEDIAASLGIKPPAPPPAPAMCAHVAMLKRAEDLVESVLAAQEGLLMRDEWSETVSCLMSFERDVKAALASPCATAPVPAPCGCAAAIRSQVLDQFDGETCTENYQNAHKCGCVHAVLEAVDAALAGPGCAGEWELHEDSVYGLYGYDGKTPRTVVVAQTRETPCHVCGIDDCDHHRGEDVTAIVTGPCRVRVYRRKAGEEAK